MLLLLIFIGLRRLLSWSFVSDFDIMAPWNIAVVSSMLFVRQTLLNYVTVYSCHGPRVVPLSTFICSEKGSTMFAALM